MSATAGTAAPDAGASTLAAALQPMSLPAAGIDAAPADTGAWGPILDWGQQAKHMAMLSTGKVLVWSTGDNARVWDPANGTFKLTPFTFGDLHCAGQSTLADGRVIVIGGQNVQTHAGTNITALFDPATETWVNGASMHDLRWYATSTTLADGKVLATSGDAPDGSRSTIPEVYNPTTNTWVQLTTAQRSQGLYPFMFVLPSGLVYEAGSGTGTALLDPSGTGHWTPGPAALYSTNGYSESAVQYMPGKILRAGGGDPSIKTAMVIDMNVANPSWRAIDPMAFARRRMNLMLLADGTVMAIGGTASGDSEAAAVLAGEIWDPATEQWSTVESMGEARMYHSSAVLLADGRVVVGGGEAGGRLRSQIYSPPYLFNGARPVITGSPASAAYGTTIQVTSPDAASITSVALLRPPASTHAFDMNQRYVPLSFSRSGNTLNAIGPASGGYAPPGDYMLIIKNAAGVPSVAKFVRIGTSGGLQPGTVAGKVTDSVTHAAIQGATVASSAGNDTTDSQGKYSISGVPAGELQLTFSQGGYATETRSALVTGGQTTTLDVELAPPGGVAGRVTDSSTGDPIVGATVSYPGGVTITNGSGDYQINGVPAGSLDVSYSALGYVSDTRTVIVPAGGVVTRDIGLSPSATFVGGEVRDLATDALIVGATVSVLETGATTTTDALGRYHIDLPPGDYTVMATAVGHDASSGPVLINGGSYATLDFALAPTAPTAPPTTAPPTTPPPTTPPPTTPPPTSPPATLSFAPVADSHGKSNSATKNYGTEALIRLRQGTSSSDTFYTSYLRFTVAGLAGRTVTSAKLRLFATDGGPNAGSLYKMGATWTETGITWANAPARVEPALRTMGTVANNAWVEFDLPAGTIAADGAIAFTLVGGNSNSVYYTSREGTNKPELRIVVGGTATAPPTTAPPTTAPPTTAPPTTAPPTTAPPTTAPPTLPPTAPPTGGTRIKDITFEAGLLNPTNGVDSITGAVTLDTASPLKGTSSARLDQSTGYLQEGFTATDDLFVSFRVRLTSVPSASPRIAMLSSSGTTSGNFLLTSTGRLRLRLDGTVIGADSAPLAPGTTYVVGLHQKRGTGSNGVLEAFLAVDGVAFGAPFASRTNGTWTTGTDRLRIGATNSSAVNFVLDDILLASGAMPATALASSTNGIIAASAPGVAQPGALLASVSVATRPRYGLTFVCPI